MGDGFDEQTEMYCLLAIRTALHLQRKGVRLSASLGWGTDLAREELGIEGSYDSVLSEVCKMIDDARSLARRSRLN